MSARDGLTRVFSAHLLHYNENANKTTVANVNGTLYIYGGNSKSSSSQTSNTWSKFSVYS